MKKHQLVAAVGTMTLVANLLIPGLTFAADQTGTATIICDTAVPLLTVSPRATFNLTPDGNQLTNITASSSAQNAFSNATGTLDPTGNHDFIAIEDLRDPSANNGLSVCNSGVKLEVATTTPFETAAHVVIPLTGFKLVTTASGIANAFPSDYTPHNVHISMGPGTLFGKGDGIAAAAWAGEGGSTPFDNTAASINFATPATFSLTPALSSTAQTVFQFTHNSVSGGELYGKAGVGLAYYVLIPAGQPSGIYTVGITYTISALRV